MDWTRPPEPYAPLQPVTSCDPTPKPGVEAFRDWVIERWGGRTGGIARECSVGPPSKHHEGRAWDWMVPDTETGDAAVAELVAERDGEPDELARRAGLRTIIWYGRIWVAGQGWTPYTKSPHQDHVHFGFGWDGAYGRTSFYATDKGGAARALPFRSAVGDGGDPSVEG